MIVYASTDDLTSDWLDDVPDDADRLLRSATRLVALAAGRNPYSDTPPTGTEADALRDATCAQVAAWVKAGIDPTSGAAGEQAPLKRTELFEGKVEYDTKAVVDARAAAVKDLANEARSILQIAGLLVVARTLFDEAPTLPGWGLAPAESVPWLLSERMLP